MCDYTIPSSSVHTHTHTHTHTWVFHSISLVTSQYEVLPSTVADFSSTNLHTHESWEQLKTVSHQPPYMHHSVVVYIVTIGTR